MADRPDQADVASSLDVRDRFQRLDFSLTSSQLDFIVKDRGLKPLTCQRDNELQLELPQRQCD